MPGRGDLIRLPELRWRDLDLLLLAALIFLTAVFGPAFTKLEFGGDTVYVTEIALVAAVVAALAIRGPIKSLAPIGRLPLIPLAVFWIAGVIASARGIAVEGLANTLEDIGLFEYSLVVPVIAVIAYTPDRIARLGGAMILGAGVSTLVYLVSYIFPELIRIQSDALTYGTYMALFAAWVVAQIACGRRLPWPMLAVAALGLGLILLASVRAVWIGLLLGLAAAIVLAPSARVRLAFRAAAAGVAALALAIGIQQLQSGEAQIVTELGGATEGLSNEEAADLPTEDPVSVPRRSEPSQAPSEESANVSWRLEFWEEAIARTADQPLLGAGFGEPFRFIWEGLKYDFRDGDPFASIDTAGNHNSFIYVLYRMGIPALLALLAIVGYGLGRALVSRSDQSLAEQPITPVALFAMVMAAIGVALWTDALKSPFLALAFWFPLGMLLAQRAASAADRPAE